MLINHSGLLSSKNNKCALLFSVFSHWISFSFRWTKETIWRFLLGLFHWFINQMSNRLNKIIDILLNDCLFLLFDDDYNDYLQSQTWSETHSVINITLCWEPHSSNFIIKASVTICFVCFLTVWIRDYWCLQNESFNLGK